ncbi:ferrous iron transport protein A [Kamptonema cortianum]|nr:ferrous iron transport protein A [Geitlerinema splendidum]MDK3158533.1 ferrous iron transport protein A [Kamptonema cortianum]
MEKFLTARDLKKGMRARVASIDEGQELCPRLLELGLLPGTEFKVIKIAPLGDPIEISLRGYKLCLRKSEAGCLKLTQVD